MAATTTTALKPTSLIATKGGVPIQQLSTKSCCPSVGNDQKYYMSYVIPSSQLSPASLSSNSVNFIFPIPPGFPVHIASQCYLDLPVINTSPATAVTGGYTGYTGAYGVTGSTGFGVTNFGDICLVNAYAWFQNFTENIGGKDYSQKFTVGEHHHMLNSYIGDQQLIIDEKAGINPVNYGDAVVVHSQNVVSGSITYVRLPINLTLIAAGIPLCYDKLTTRVTLLTNGGPQLIALGPTDGMQYIQLVVEDIKLFIGGLALGAGALKDYRDKLQKAPVRYNFYESQFYQYGIPGTLVTNQNVQVNFTTIANMVGGYFQVSYQSATGASMTYGIVPLISTQLCIGSVDQLSGLSTYQNWTSLQLEQQADFLQNIRPQLSQNMTLITASDHFLDNLENGGSNGLLRSGGSNISLFFKVGVVPGGTVGPNLTMNGYIFGKSYIILDFNNETVVDYVRNIAE